MEETEGQAIGRAYHQGQASIVTIVRYEQNKEENAVQVRGKEVGKRRKKREK